VRSEDWRRAGQRFIRPCQSRRGCSPPSCCSLLPGKFALKEGLKRLEPLSFLVSMRDRIAAVGL
jgi:hypothetical protein